MAHMLFSKLGLLFAGPNTKGSSILSRIKGLPGRETPAQSSYAPVISLNPLNHAWCARWRKKIRPARQQGPVFIRG